MHKVSVIYFLDALLRLNQDLRRNPNFRIGRLSSGAPNKTALRGGQYQCVSSICLSDGINQRCFARGIRWHYAGRIALVVVDRLVNII